MAQLPLVSIIIPSYNRKEELIACLQSVERQDYKYMNVTVVDDHSTDGTVEALKKRFPWVNVIQNRVNCGPSYRRNQGILATQGEYLHFLDSDVELQNSRLVSLMVDRLMNDRSIGELGGEIRVYEGNTSEAFGRSISYMGRTSRKAANASGGDATPCDYLATCNVMVSREATLRVAGFDPYYEFGAEDSDFGVSLRKAGYRNLVGFSYAARHMASPKGRHYDETYRYQVTRIRFLLKHYGVVRTLLLATLDCLRILLFYPVLPLKVLVKLLLRKPIKRESFTDPWFVIKAYTWNIRHFRETLHARTKNFLSPEEMRRFRAIKREGDSL